MAINEKGTVVSGGGGGGGGGGGQPTDISSRDFTVTGAGYSKEINLKPQEIDSAVATAGGKFDVKIDGTTIKKGTDGKLFSIASSDGTVQSVDGVLPNSVGNVDLKAENIPAKLTENIEGYPVSDALLQDALNEKSNVGAYNGNYDLLQDVIPLNLKGAKITFDKTYTATAMNGDEKKYALYKDNNGKVSARFIVSPKTTIPDNGNYDCIFSFVTYDDSDNIVNATVIYGPSSANPTIYEWKTTEIVLAPNINYFATDSIAGMPTFLATAFVSETRNIKNIDVQKLANIKMDTFKTMRGYGAVINKFKVGDNLRGAKLTFSQKTDIPRLEYEEQLIKIDFANGWHIYLSKETFPSMFFKGDFLLVDQNNIIAETFAVENGDTMEWGMSEYVMPDSDDFIITSYYVNQEAQTPLITETVVSAARRLTNIDSIWLYLNGLYNGKPIVISKFVWQLAKGNNIAKSSIRFMTKAPLLFSMKDGDSQYFNFKDMDTGNTGQYKAWRSGSKYYIDILMPDGSTTNILKDWEDNGDKWEKSSFNFNDYGYKRLFITDTNLNYKESWSGQHFMINVISPYSTIGTRFDEIATQNTILNYVDRI